MERHRLVGLGRCLARPVAPARPADLGQIRSCNGFDNDSDFDGDSAFSSTMVARLRMRPVAAAAIGRKSPPITPL